MRIALVGDIHLHFDTYDIDYFNQSDYSMILFVGDLSVLGQPTKSMEVATRLSKLRIPAIFIPGNHDVHNVFQIIAEILHNRTLAWFTGLFHNRFHRLLQEWLGPVALGGYKVHSIKDDRFPLDVVTGRPWAMGGTEISFGPLLKRLYGVQSRKDSTDLICSQVDAAKSNNLIFLAHNGPWGLGEQPSDIWGCDFDPKLGDFGDGDLTDSVQYGRSRGKNVVAVLAGHMHLQTYLGPKPVWQRRGTPGPIRPWHVVREGIHYINAARVPRIFEQDGAILHHHIRINLNDSDVEVREMLIEKQSSM